MSRLQDLRDQLRSTVSGYGDGADYRELARRLGLLIIDTRTVPDEIAHKMIALPLMAIGAREQDPPRADGTYGALALAPRAYVVEGYRALGATIENFQ